VREAVGTAVLNVVVPPACRSDEVNDRLPVADAGPENEPLKQRSFGIKPPGSILQTLIRHEVMPLC
jgi:hypothetical protein